MKNTSIKIQKITERGQITLPKAWRDYHQTNLIKLINKEGIIEIIPIKEIEEEIVWSAARDNNGKGIDTDDFIALLDKAIASK